MNKPIIGIIGRTGLVSDDDNVIYANDNYLKAIITSGGIPMLILPTQPLSYNKTKIKKLTKEEKDDLIAQIKKCNGILLPGGYNWQEFDQFICNYAMEKNIPTLGICLGMQIMGTPYTNKKTDTTIPATNHNHSKIKSIHHVIINKNTMLYDIIKQTRIMVNSKHNYQITKTNNFTTSAVSDDGTIEAIEIPNKCYFIGVQWHPETMLEDYNNRKIFNKFIEICKNN